MAEELKNSVTFSRSRRTDCLTCVTFSYLNIADIKAFSNVQLHNSLNVRMVDLLRPRELLTKLRQQRPIHKMLISQKYLRYFLCKAKFDIGINVVSKKEAIKQIKFLGKHVY